jgi:predicted HAD superfamily Cof-like phosphohydrolase
MKPSAADLGVDETIHSVFEFHEAFGIENAELPRLPKFNDPEVSQVLTEAIALVREASRKLRKHAEDKAQQWGHSILPMRAHLMTEELAEIMEGMVAGDFLNLLKEFADLRYVVDGSLLSLGLARGFLPAFRATHQSNMSKLVDGRPLKSEGGRVIKGPNYKPPDIYPALAIARQGLRAPWRSSGADGSAVFIQGCAEDGLK